MGIGGISIWQLLIILLIVLLLFGTKKLRNMGGDLGTAIKNFRKSVKDPDGPAADGSDQNSDEDSAQRREGGELPGTQNQPQGRVFDAEGQSKASSDSGSRQA